MPARQSWPSETRSNRPIARTHAPRHNERGAAAAARGRRGARAAACRRPRVRTFVEPHVDGLPRLYGPCRRIHATARQGITDKVTIQAGPALDAGSTITMRMFYRSVEDGTYGDVEPMPASASDGEGGTIPGAWSNDCRCTLYIDLQ
eukprot:COSAG02_NODE_648_length_18943_cov_924.526746_2_plen_147_part_00